MAPLARCDRLERVSAHRTGSGRRSSVLRVWAIEHSVDRTPVWSIESGSIQCSTESGPTEYGSIE
jgi:hypothetical protein